MRLFFQKLIVSLLLSFALLSFVSAKDQPLEVSYPEIGGVKPTTVKIPLADYVVYIFNFAVVVVGIIAFGVLIFAGFRYFTSAGKPEIIKSAKSQIKSAFLGILILLFSYIILTTINPQLVIFHLPQLTTGPAETPPASEPLVITPIYLLEKIKKMVENVKTILSNAESLAHDLKSLTNNCDCKTTHPLCLCRQYKGGSCEALYCYSQKETEPCPDWQKIEDTRQKTIAHMFEILYYRNRALAEKEDILLEIKQIEKDIDYFQKRLKDEERILGELTEEKAKKNQEMLVSWLKEQKEKNEKEKGLKEKLSGKLSELEQKIKELAEGNNSPMKEITESPNECLFNVKDKCKGTCQGGCYDYKECAPKDCSGGNPCPTDKIENAEKNIKSISEPTKKISDEIISIVDELIVFKTVIIK